MIARFIGDPNGYFIHPDHRPRSGEPRSRWTPAQIGYTNVHVHVDLSMAYRIDCVPPVPPITWNEATPL